MPVLLFNGAAGLPHTSGDDPDALVYANSHPRQDEQTNLNTKEGFAAADLRIVDGDTATGPIIPYVGEGDAGAYFSSHDGDYRHRYHVLPRHLTLTNPQSGQQVNFTVWNTYLNPYELNSTDIFGDIQNIDFNYGIGETLRDNEHLLVTATVILPTGISSKFEFEQSKGGFNVQFTFIAGNAFEMFPDVPVKETWDYLTEIIETWDSGEQRVSHREEPRLMQTIALTHLDLDQRRDIWSTLDHDVKEQHRVRMFQYAVHPTANSVIGSKTIYMPTENFHARVGQQIDIINLETSGTQTTTITAIEPNHILVDDPLSSPVTPLYLILPLFTGFMEDNPSLKIHSITSDVELTAHSLNPMKILRDNINRTFPTLEGMSVLDKRPLSEADEQFYFRQQVLRNSVGKVQLKRYLAETRNIGSRSWLVNTLNDDDPYYLRAFIRAHKGAWKAFLLPTWLPDIEFLEQPETSGTRIRVGREVDLNNARMARIMVQYNTGARTYHRIIANDIDGEGRRYIVLNPGLKAIQIGEKVTEISYLMKVRGNDKIDLHHYGLHTIYTWSFTSVVR